MALAGVLAVTVPGARAQETPVNVRTLAERGASELPAGALAWRVERFPTRGDAEAAAGSTGLAVEAGGAVYLVSLLGSDRPPARGRVLAEISPLVRPNAPEYLLRVSELTGPPGSQSPVHSHPGVESYFVIAGELRFRSPDGATTVGAGQGSPGVPGGTAVQATSNGSENLLGLVLFAVDATLPLTAPATLPSEPPALSTGMLALVAVLVALGVGLTALVAARLGRRTR